MNIRCLILFAFICISKYTYSQYTFINDSCYSNSSIGLRFHFGSVVPHEEILNPLKKEFVKSVEIIYTFNPNSNKIWHKYYNYPKLGISYMFMDFGYKKVLGYTNSIYSFLDFPITRSNKPLQVSLKPAIGLSYVNKTYDSITNPINIAISTHLNFTAQLGFTLNYQLTKSLSANIGFTAFHFSNGSTCKPNYGLNILTASCGMSYCFNYCENRNTNYEIPPTETRWLLIPCGGVKESIYPNGSKYGIGSFSVEYSKPFKTLLRYGAAFDCMYDGSTFVHFREDSIPYRSKLKALKIGIAGVGEMSLDRFSLFVNLGVYLYNHDKQIDFLYQRIGLRYRISRSLYTQISLKTHLNISDYIEYGILIRI